MTETEAVTVDLPEHLLASIDTLDPTLGVTREERVQYLLKRALLDLPDGAIVPGEVLASYEVEDTYEMWELRDEVSDEASGGSIVTEQGEDHIMDALEGTREQSTLGKGLSWLYGNGEANGIESISTDIMDGVTCTILTNENDPDVEQPMISFRADNALTEQDERKLMKRARPALDDHDTRVMETRGGAEHKHLILLLNRKPSPSDSIPSGWSP